MHAYLTRFLKNKNGIVFVNLVNVVHYWKKVAIQSTIII